MDITSVPPRPNMLQTNKLTCYIMMMYIDPYRSNNAENEEEIPGSGTVLGTEEERRVRLSSGQ